MISIPGALLITPIKVRQSALAQALLFPAHIARATDSQVRFFFHWPCTRGVY